MFFLFVDEEHKSGRFFFKAVKEGDQVLFATDEELERQIWVNKLYTATGQSHKPVAPNLSAVTVQGQMGTLARLQGGGWESLPFPVFFLTHPTL